MKRYQQKVRSTLTCSVGFSNFNYALKGPDHYVDAAVCFFKALRVYPVPTELIGIYERTQPAEVYALISKL